MTSELINSLVEKITQIAPHVWAILMKQVYLMGAKELMGSFICIGVAVVFAMWAKRLKKDDENVHETWENPYKCTYVNWLFSDDNSFWAVVLVMIAVVAAIIGIVVFADGIGYFINPKYYAIKLLMPGD